MAQATGRGAKPCHPRTINTRACASSLLWQAVPELLIRRYRVAQASILQARAGAKTGSSAIARLVRPHTYPRPGRHTLGLLSVTPCTNRGGLLCTSPLTFLVDEQVIAPMCSTTRTRNGFQYEMLPIALNSQDTSSRALCNAMLAISAYHYLGSAAALPYKVNTMRALSMSLTATSTGHPAEIMEAQLAACMMLSMYSVSNHNRVKPPPFGAENS